MIRYRTNPPGGEGILSTIVRLWWTFISHYHILQWLLPQVIQSHRRFVLPRNESKVGETAVVTGGSRGVGASLVKTLLQANMHVIIGCRNTTEAYNAVKRIRRRGITTGTVETLYLDLTSLNSIREFCNRICRKNYIVSLLVNNAGVCETPYGTTVEGIEHNFQVNYLGHFFVTYLLLRKLNESAEALNRCSRVVNVSSAIHFGGYPDLTDVEMRRFYSFEKSQMDSKLMMIAFSNYLDRQLLTAGASVRSLAVHPGFVNIPAWSKFRWMRRISLFTQIMFRTADQAAESIAYTGLSSELNNQGGVFYAENEIVTPHPLATDPEFQRNLWEISHTYLDLEDHLSPKPLPPRKLSASSIMHSTKAELDFENRNSAVTLMGSGTAKFSLKISAEVSTTCSDSPQAFVKPYYEFFINNIFEHRDLNKSALFRNVEVLSIFLLKSLDRFNSQFRLIQIFE